MKKTLLLGMVFAVLFGLASCTDIDNLSDANSIKSFRITSHSPEKAELGEVEVTEDGIYIPVIYGKDKFPLTIKADLSYTKKIDRLLGVNFREGVTFQSIDDKVEFVVVAESGLARKYTMEMKAVDFRYPEHLEFLVKSATPANTLVFGKAALTEDEMVISLVEPVYPLSLVLEFELGDNLSFDGFENGSTPLSFDKGNSTATLVLEDRINGSKRDITVRTQSLDVVEPGEQYEMTDIFAPDLTISLEGAQAVEIMGFVPDNENDDLAVYLRPTGDGFSFPVTVAVEVKPSTGYTQTIGLDKPVTLNGFNDPVVFYYGDTENGIARRWTLRAVEYSNAALDSEADVLSFAYDYEVGDIGGHPAITLDRGNTVISPQTAEVILAMTGVTEAMNSDDWTLTLKEVKTVLSPGAEAILPEFKWVGNDSWMTPKTFDVTAMDGTVKTWTLSIRDTGTYTPQTECDIVGVTVRELLPYGAHLVADDPVRIDQTEKRIYVNLESVDGYYPLSLSLAYDLSLYARVTSQNGNTQRLVFTDRNSTNTVTVVSEDGRNSNDYEVVLNPATLQGIPNVRKFDIKSFSSVRFALGSTRIDAEAGEVVVTLASGGSCPVTIGYEMEVNRGAKAGIPNTGSFTFNNLNDTKTFTVTAGNEQKQWTVRIKEFTPQLTNWQLDDWKDANTPNPAGVKGAPYWTTANNSLVKGTARGTGKSGYAAQLTTGTAPLIGRLTSGSIFLGWFDTSNIFTGLTDPVKLTFQGIEFSASKKLVGMEMDIKYTAAGAGDDTGSLAIELIKHNSTEEYVYHGIKPDKDTPPSSWQPHPENTAVRYARGRQLVGNLGGTQHGESILQVPKDTWTTVRVNLDYTGVTDVFGYTHLLIICASSSQGDIFIGTKESQLVIDNIRLIYE